MAAKSLLPILTKLQSISLTYNVFRKLEVAPCLYKFNISLCNITTSNIFLQRSKTDNDKNGFDQSKAKIIQLLNLQTAADALPFYKLPIRTLVHIYKTTKNDDRNGFCKNRLYYISSRIKCPPSVLSEKIAKRTFIYSLSFHWLESSLDVLLEMGVSSDRIARDLWVLKYSHVTIRKRLQRIKSMGVDNVYPWMVRCSEPILNRFIRISQETKHILGETKSTQMYLADRLNTSLDNVTEMCSKMPALKTIRVTKVKTFLDFLIKEGFEVEDIASKPRVLAAAQKTVKLRLDTLRKLGLQQINLNILCRSRKDFKKYCETFESIMKENKTKSSESQSKS